MEFIDLKAQYRTYKQELDQDMRVVLDSAEFIGGRYVDRLEQELAAYVGRRYCISCANGTDALQLAYMAYGIEPGDAVFCPDMTYIASIEPAVMLGATPVFVDIDPLSYNIDPVALKIAVERVVKEGRLRPRFVVAVDFLGNPADYDEIVPICERYGMTLIEDAAQGMGGEYKGRRLCACGDISATSFFPSKPLGCYGDGGAVFTDDDRIADIIKSIKVHGKGSSKYDNIRIGINSRLDNIQAAVLCVKLKHLEQEMDVRQAVASKYNAAFDSYIQHQIVSDDCRCAYAQYVLCARDFNERLSIMTAMRDNDIPSLVYYPKEMHQMDAFRMSSFIYPNATRYAMTNFGLPMSAFLEGEDQESVISCIISALKK